MLTAQLTGGLGNQLFTYTRLALLAKEFDTRLQIDGSVTERVLGHTPDLFEFNLMDENRISRSDYGKIQSQVERALWRWEFSRNVSKRYQSTILGNKSKFPSDLRGWKIRGFFQDFKVAEEFLETFTIKPLTLKTESPSLRNYSAGIEAEPTLAIHMRRGDYLNYSDSFGVLSDEYYLNAISTVSREVNFQKVLIFSDSPELTHDIREKIKIPVQVVTAKDLSTCENLILMSRCSAIVTSNSTFSFWAATLASHDNIVIPKPWFKSDDEWLRSSNFENETWQRCESRWLI